MGPLISVGERRSLGLPKISVASIGWFKLRSPCGIWVTRNSNPPQKTWGGVGDVLISEHFCMGKPTKETKVPC